MDILARTGLFVGLALFLASGCAGSDASASDDFIPSFERNWVDETGDSFFFVSDAPAGAPTGNLSGNRNDAAGTQFDFTGTFSGRRLNFVEKAGLSYQGTFSDADTIMLNRSDGATRKVHRQP